MTAGNQILIEQSRRIHTFQSKEELNLPVFCERNANARTFFNKQEAENYEQNSK